MFRRREQKRLVVCFYCNTPSTVAVDRHVPLRKWHCHQCEQTNHLDENGDIADYTPPAHSSPSAPPRPASPSSATASPALSSPFCDTCISNQTLLIKNLASFLPAEDHPDYDTYAAALPAHKAELEIKYPQVCADCEERVRSRLQRNNYLAKTSALGGFLKRRRLQQEVAERQWGVVMWVRTAIWFVRGMLWWISTVSFLFWCIIAFIRPELVGASHNLADDFRIPRFVEELCSLFSDPFWTTTLRAMPRAISSISPFVVMWDYQWLAAKRIPGSQVENLREYRELQVIVIALRLLAWGMTTWTTNPLVIMWGSAFLGAISLIVSKTRKLSDRQALIWSLGILKVKLPPEIALQDTPDDLDFTPQSSPSPTPNLRPASHTFQRTQPPPPTFSALKPPNDSPDLTSLGISEKPGKRFPSFRDSNPLPSIRDAQTMDWTPSTQSNTFTPRTIPAYSQEKSVFAAGRGTLPPAPGRGFPTTTNAAQSNEVNWLNEANWFQPTGTAPLNPEPLLRNEDTHLREQRLFIPQEMTGLESLLGQALTLDDEPTLVRAVKAVKRNMARDKHLHRAYGQLAISTTATLLFGLSAKFSRFQGGLSAAYIAWAVARVVLDYRISSFLTSILAILFGLLIGLPVSGLVIPYHPILLRLYDPRIQNTLRVAGAILLVGVLARDSAIVITMKLDRRKMAAEEERKRQERMKGIFYAKPAPAGRSVSLWNGGGTVRERGRDGGHSKSKSMFSTTRY